MIVAQRNHQKWLDAQVVVALADSGINHFFMGKGLFLRHISSIMSSKSESSRLAQAAAEEILRTIYGDDFAGCTVSLDQIALIIQAALTRQGSRDQELLELHEKATEAMKLLSTPPDAARQLAPGELQSLLSDRLDAVRALASKVLDTSKRAKEGSV